MSQVNENHCCDAQMPENTTQNEQENVDEGFDALTKQLLTDLKQEFGDKMPDKHLFKQTAKFERKSDIFNKKKTEKFRVSYFFARNNTHQLFDLCSVMRVRW